MSLLHRQVSSHLQRDGRPAWVAFKPTQRDEGKLSVSCDLLCSASLSFQRYTSRVNARGRNLQSDGVRSVSRGECAQLDRKVEAAPLADDDSHTLIDFTDLDEAGVERAAMELHNFAVARGWQYEPQRQDQQTAAG